MTEASTGIGLELARQFVDNGFDVLVTAKDEESSPPPGRNSRPVAEVSISSKSAAYMHSQAEAPELSRLIGIGPSRLHVCGRR